MSKPSTPPARRFMIGDNVLFRRSDLPGWHEGTVEELDYQLVAKEAKGRPRRYPYRVEQKSRLDPSVDKLVTIECDTEAHIRVKPHRKGQAPVLYGDVPMTVPKDSLDFLYRPPSTHPAFQIYEELQQLKTDDKHKWQSVQKLANGAILTQSTGPSSDQWVNDTDSPKFLIPKLRDESWTYRGLSIQWIVGYILPRIEMRRPILGGNYTKEQIMDSIFPDQELTLEQLESTVQRFEKNPPANPLTRCRKLLQLGDALLFLFPGRRNFDRALQCYTMAGGDFSESEAEDTSLDSHWVGLPEALCAKATLTHISTERLAYGSIHGISMHQEIPVAGTDRPMLTVNDIFARAQDAPKVSPNICCTVSLLAIAVEKGWFSSLAFQYAVALSDEKYEMVVNQLCSNPMDKRRVETLVRARRQHQIRLQIRDEKLGLTKVTQRGIPTAETLAAFGPHAVEILRHLPIWYHPIERRGAVEPQKLELHISLFELPISWSPLCVRLVCPATGTVELFRIPDELQLFPFSDETLEWVWHRIAFCIHLGLKRGNDKFPHEGRVRPQTLVFKNVGGDIELANQCQLKCLSLPGTRVQLVDVTDEDADDYGFHDVDRALLWDNSIELGIDELREEEAKGQPSFFSGLKHRSKSMLSVMRGYLPLSVVARTDADVTGVVQTVEKIKVAGNSAFGKNSFHSARRQYEKGISELRRIVNPSPRVYQLVGILLSNLAMCGLEMAKCESPDYEMFTLKQVVSACDVALCNKQIQQVCVAAVWTKLNFRKELALSRQPEVDPAIFLRKDEIAGDHDVVYLDIEFNLRLFAGEDQLSEKKPDIEFSLGKDIQSNISECPICHEQFSGRLSGKYVVRTPCSHFHCTKCFLQWKNTASKMQCGLCREQISEEMMESALIRLVKSLPDIERRLEHLPLDNYAMKRDVFRSLLVKHDMDLEATENAVDDILYLNNCGRMWSASDLTPQKKQEICEEARAPIVALEAELISVQHKLDQALDTTSADFQRGERQLRDVREKLHAAKENARQEVFSQMNSAGSMGRENDSDQGIYLDFHGLKVKEAKSKLDELVLPVLPFVPGVIVVTGRGAHSLEKRGVLQPALKNYLKKRHSSTVDWKVLENNAGALRIWQKTDLRLD